mmetsp:Transcript_57667/g.137220  ORF Transcript_57667/g.137220 Transcript_57667/m.137220 type:complete len:234 (-) Transcript_57667:691-1392(-)
MGQEQRRARGTRQVGRGAQLRSRTRRIVHAAHQKLAHRRCGAERVAVRALRISLPRLLLWRGRELRIMRPQDLRHPGPRHLPLQPRGVRPVPSRRRPRLPGAGAPEDGRAGADACEKYFSELSGSGAGQHHHRLAPLQPHLPDWGHFHGPRARWVPDAGYGFDIPVQRERDELYGDGVCGDVAAISRAGAHTAGQLADRPDAPAPLLVRGSEPDCDPGTADRDASGGGGLKHD